MATALPSMARALDIPVLDLNLAITAYLASLAIFLPGSAWLAERFGAKRVFCVAVLVFSLGSALCALAATLSQLVACRLLQGVGGAMMVPVGRAILLRNVPPQQLVSAMVWFTLPGAVGRLAGPFFGGAIVTVTSWQWIFLVNIPFGALGVAMALWILDKDPPPMPQRQVPLDILGLALLALAFAGVLGGLELAGKGILPPSALVLMFLCGVGAFGAYIHRSRRLDSPVLDVGVLRYPTFRIAVVGAFPLRVAIGAAPFLLPLMMQVGLGLSPMKTGTLMMGMALGSLCTRAALVRMVHAVGFRVLLVGSAGLAAGFYAAYGLFALMVPQAVMFAVLFLGGLCTSMTMVALNTVAYADVPPARTSHATAMAAMAQQLSLAVGVMLGANLVALASLLNGRASTSLQASDFPPAFGVVALLAFTSALAFRRLAPEAGEETRQAREFP